MAVVAVQCPKCQQPLLGETATDWASLKACPACGQALEITRLPGHGRRPRVGQLGADRVSDTEAACFFHATKRAEVPCDRCGRFLCALCRLELAGQNLCPTCLNAAAGAGDVPALEKERFRWDLLVWMLTLGPLVTLCLWWLTPVTCLAAVGLGLWQRNCLPSRIHRSRGWLMAGVTLALVLLVAGALLLLYVMITDD